MTAMNRSNLEYYKDTQIDLATILRTLFDHKKLIAGVVALFTLLGAFYAVVATPVYQANAMIQIEPKKVGLDATPQLNTKPSSVSEAVTEIELIKSRTVLGQVVSDLKLDVVATPRYFPAIGRYMAREFTRNWPRRCSVWMHSPGAARRSTCSTWTCRKTCWASA